MRDLSSVLSLQLMFNLYACSLHSFSFFLPFSFFLTLHSLFAALLALLFFVQYSHLAALISMCSLCRSFSSKWW